MKVYRISKRKYINDLSGFGAAHFPGRWNNKGSYLLYTAATPSLAMLESVVHINKIVQDEYALAKIELPDVFCAEINVDELPENWSVFPPPDVLKTIGDEFIQQQKYLALKVPSSIMPEEFNVLVNPAHADFAKVKIKSVRKLEFDSRLYLAS